eukprot:TRINITY_DN19211_c0_g1_i1.p1 TRINITY_DN19211_c0_g1~~TRINITY_DN19211_c0_g1_i1.p1  ORF type:complete len:592 (+),score=153.00 TRINITY_DN19211_c0_g1_i1:145-1776(+)
MTEGTVQKQTIFASKVQIEGRSTVLSSRSSVASYRRYATEKRPNRDPSASMLVPNAPVEGRESEFEEDLDEKAEEEFRTELDKLTPFEQRVAARLELTPQLHKKFKEFMNDEKKDPNEKDKDGWTALHYATLATDREFVELLLERGADVDLHAPQGVTALRNVIASMDDGIFNVLLQAGADPHQISDFTTGGTVLHEVALEGSPGMVDFLLKHGVDVDETDYMGRTALHYAAVSGRPEMVSHLIKCKAKLNPLDREGILPIQYAMDCGHSGCAEILGAAGANPGDSSSTRDDVFFKAIRDSNLDLVKALLASGGGLAYNTNPNEADDTTLHAAAYSGNLEMLEMFLEKKVPIDSVNSQGFTPLHVAIIQNHSQSVARLVKAGANIKAVTNLNQSAVHLAVMLKDVNMLYELIHMGFPLELKNSDGSTPFHYAMKEDMKVHAVALMEAGANINVHDLDHETPLHTAVAQGSAKWVEMLLNKGAKTKVKNLDGVTPLMLARQLQRPRAIMLLNDEPMTPVPKVAQDFMQQVENKYKKGELRKRVR